MKTLRLGKEMLLLSFLIVVVILTGCAKSEIVNTCLSGHTYGFLEGCGMDSLRLSIS
jgi:hypothetical protein